MSTLKFSLSPDSTEKVHDLLVCLAKFGEYVSLEVKGNEQVRDVATIAPIERICRYYLC